MMFATALRWLGLEEPPHATTMELACGGRVSLQDSDGNTVLSVTTAPDANGQSHAVAVPLSPAERAEIHHALDAKPALPE